MHARLIYSLFVLAALLVVALVWSLGTKRLPLKVESLRSRSYSSVEFRLSFNYPAIYYLHEQRGTRPELALVLVEDTQENRDLLNGVSTEPREGPPSMTVEVYTNPKQLSAEEWMRELTNWGTGAQEVAPITVSGVQGLRYRWSGLYEGSSVLLVKSGLTYVLSVSSLTPNDAIVSNFETLVGTVKI